MLEVFMHQFWCPHKARLVSHFTPESGMGAVLPQPLCGVTTRPQHIKFSLQVPPFVLLCEMHMKSLIAWGQNMDM